MLKAQIKSGGEYALLEKRGEPFQHVKIIAHIRGTKWRAGGMDQSECRTCSFRRIQSPHCAMERAQSIPVRTLQEWEQGRRAPSGAARTLLLIAAKNPQALLD